MRGLVSRPPPAPLRSRLAQTGAARPGLDGRASGGAGDVGHELEGFVVGARDGQALHAGVFPGAELLADALGRTNERLLVDELVGDRGGCLILAPGEVELLDARRCLRVASENHAVVVEVLGAMAHAADVERAR